MKYFISEISKRGKEKKKRKSIDNYYLEKRVTGIGRKKRKRLNGTSTFSD